MMKKRSQITKILIITFILLLYMGTGIAAAQTATIQKIEGPENVTSPTFGLGVIGSGATTTGEYKRCSTDAYFYAILVNNSSDTMSASLPRRIQLEGMYYYVDNSEYMCKTLPADWEDLDYANANGGVKCPLDDNRMSIPPNTALSLRGKVVNFNHELSRDVYNVEERKYISINFPIVIGNRTIIGHGSITEEESMCDSLQYIPVSDYNMVDGSYYIDPTEKKRCSMNFYFTVRNPDEKFSTAVELPRWLVLNEDRWDVGCAFLYDGCPVSGFRHYAWSISEEGDPVKNLDYHFCDQDRKEGNFCYEQQDSDEHEKDLWWLHLPPLTTITVRGMVNSLCNDAERPNPTRNDVISAEIIIRDAGSNSVPIDGDIIGTSGKQAKDIDETALFSQIEDRDPEENISKYIFEDPSLAIIGPSGAMLTVESASETVIEFSSAETVLPTQNSKTEEPVEAISKEIPAELEQKAAAEQTTDFWVWSQWKGTDFGHQTLPNTGFPANMNTALKTKPADLIYRDIGNYQIEIPSDNIVANLVEVPYNSENGWQVEWLDYEAGLLEGSALPGSGASIIAAHNHLSNGTVGPFFSLNQMAANDRLFVRKPDGTLIQYKVYENLLVDAHDFESIQAFAVENALVLITCENETIDGGYLNRRVIFAKPIEG